MIGRLLIIALASSLPSVLLTGYATAASPKHLSLSHSRLRGNRIEGTVGGNYKINCTVKGDVDPQAQLQWDWKRMNRSNIKQWLATDSRTAVLEITSLRRNNAGLYKCRLSLPDRAEETANLWLGVEIESSDVCPWPKMFKCEKTKECLFLNFRCDNVDDCGDGSDEKCDNPCLNKFKCNNSRCLDTKYVCNRMDNCGDKSDEDPRICEVGLRPTSTHPPIAEESQYAWLHITVSTLAVTVGLVFLISFVVIIVFRLRMKQRRRQRIDRALQRLGERVRTGDLSPTGGELGMDQEFLLAQSQQRYGNIIVNVNNGVQYYPMFPPPYSEVGATGGGNNNTNSSNGGDVNPPPPYSTLERQAAAGNRSSNNNNCHGGAPELRMSQSQQQPHASGHYTTSATDPRLASASPHGSAGLCPTRHVGLAGSNAANNSNVYRNAARHGIPPSSDLTAPPRSNQNISVDPQYLQSLLGSRTNQPAYCTPAGNYQCRSLSQTPSPTRSFSEQQECSTSNTITSLDRTVSVNVNDSSAANPQVNNASVNINGATGTSNTNSASVTNNRQGLQNASLQDNMTRDIDSNTGNSGNVDNATDSGMSEEIAQTVTDGSDTASSSPLINERCLQDVGCDTQPLASSLLEAADASDDSEDSSSNDDMVPLTEDGTFLLRKPKRVTKEVTKNNSHGELEVEPAPSVLSPPPPSPQPQPPRTRNEDASNALFTEVLRRDESLKPKPGHLSVQHGEILLHTPSGIMADDTALQNPPPPLLDDASSAHNSEQCTSERDDNNDDCGGLALLNGNLVYTSPSSPRSSNSSNLLSHADGASATPIDGRVQQDPEDPTIASSASFLADLSSQGSNTQPDDSSSSSIKIPPPTTSSSSSHTKELHFKDGELVLESPTQTTSGHILSHLMVAYEEEKQMEEEEMFQPVVNTKRSTPQGSRLQGSKVVGSDVVLPHKHHPN